MMSLRGGLGPTKQSVMTDCFASLAMTAIFVTVSFASPSQLKEGNRQFKNGNYDKAVELYQDALIDTPYSSILQFNLGDALAMKGDFPKAETSFMESAKSANPLLKGASHYNRGNVLFAQGKWGDAVEAYKDSLRANPSDQDAKYNLSVALRTQRNPPPPKPGQGKPDPKQGKGSGKDQNQQSGGAQKKSDQMSKEDAERLLAAAGAGEKKKAQQKASKNDNPRPDEDW